MSRSISYHELCRDEGASLSEAYWKGYNAVGNVEWGYDGNPFLHYTQDHLDWSAGYAQCCQDEDEDFIRTRNL